MALTLTFDLVQINVCIELEEIPMLWRCCVHEAKTTLCEVSLTLTSDPAHLRLRGGWTTHFMPKLQLKSHLILFISFQEFSLSLSSTYKNWENVTL